MKLGWKSLRISCMDSIRMESLKNMKWKLCTQKWTTHVESDRSYPQMESKCRWNGTQMLTE